LKEILFKKFCRISDELLLDKNATKATIAIRSLHIIKNHPDYLYTTNNKSFFWILKYLVANFFFAILYNLRFKLDKKKIKFQNKSTILISHLVNKDFIYKKNDFYYGNLQQLFKKKKISSFKIFCNHTKINSSLINNSLAKKNIIIFEKYLDLRNEYKLFKEQLLEFFRLIKIYKNTNNLFKKKVVKQAIISLFDKETLFALKTSHQLDFYLQKINPKTLICTYEGYSWERAVFLSQKNQQTKTIGYQHSYLSKGNNSIFEVNNKDLIPNIVLTTGEITRDLFRNKNFFDKVEIFGNSKTFKISKKNKDQVKSHILVAPDGIESECIKMMKFILDFSLKNRNHNFVFRLHPVIDFEKLKKKEKIFRQNFRNIIFSREKLEFDLERSSHCLYRGSTIAFNCVLSNVVPIFVNLDDKLSINVFDGVKSIKMINNINDLEKSLKNQGIDHDALIFTEKYFHKINFEILKSL